MKFTQADPSFEGVAGEFAFCKIANLYPDLSLHLRDVKDRHDVTLPNGRTVDVKTRRQDRDRLVVAAWKAEHPADIYVQMVGAPPAYEWTGWILGKALFVPARLEDLGHGPCYTVNSKIEPLSTPARFARWAGWWDGR
jgi:hypothetical protein